MFTYLHQFQSALWHLTYWHLVTTMAWKIFIVFVRRTLWENHNFNLIMIVINIMTFHVEILIFLSVTAAKSTFCSAEWGGSMNNYIEEKRYAKLVFHPMTLFCETHFCFSSGQLFRLGIYRHDCHNDLKFRKFHCWTKVIQK